MVETLNLNLPLSDGDVHKLRAGDIVTLSGTIVTGRDRVHKHLVTNYPATKEIPFDLSGAVMYHCGPIMKKTDDKYSVIAAGPTTSIRMEMYAAAVIRDYGLKGIMGKGGMGETTLKALTENSCVYFHTIGGAAVYLAERITNVLGVWKLEEFGMAEAMWHFEIKEFPAIVTMDAHGNDIHRDIEHSSFVKFSELTGA